MPSSALMGRADFWSSFRLHKPHAIPSTRHHTSARSSGEHLTQVRVLMAPERGTRIHVLGPMCHELSTPQWTCTWLTHAYVKPCAILSTSTPSTLRRHLTVASLAMVSGSVHPDVKTSASGGMNSSLREMRFPDVAK